jgi:hypothetical protein
LIRGFISYAKNDYWALETLLVHLKAVEKALAGKIEFWADKRIEPGDYWSESIETAIRDSKLHLLLVSAAFLASDYIGRHELPAINAKYAAGDLVVPVILRGCIWEPFVGPLQAVPTARGRVVPICDWSPRDNGFHAATAQILQTIRSHFSVSIGTGLDWRRP